MPHVSLESLPYQANHRHKRTCHRDSGRVMSIIRTLFRATAVVAGSSAALFMGGLMGTAHADPVPVPAPDISQQLVGTAASAPQLLQSVAGALGGQPATPPPLASASIKMPQTPAAAPGA